MSSLDDKKAYDYSGGWFKSEIDLKDLPSGDYMLIVAAATGKYATADVFTNIAYGDMARRAKANGDREYAIDIDYTTTGSPLLFMVRDNGLLSMETPLTIDPMYNFFNNFTLKTHELTLKGTSHNVGIDYGEDKKVDRKIIFENTETFERYAYDLGSITDGDYKITLAVTDHYDKTRAWYNKTINIENLPKGNYALYIKNTVGSQTYYGELIDIAYTDFDSINNKRYTFKRIEDRRLRVELTVNH